MELHCPTSDPSVQHNSSPTAQKNRTDVNTIFGLVQCLAVICSPSACRQMRRKILHFQPSRSLSLWLPRPCFVQQHLEMGSDDICPSDSFARIDRRLLPTEGSHQSEDRWCLRELYLENDQLKICLLGRGSRSGRTWLSGRYPIIEICPLNH